MSDDTKALLDAMTDMKLSDDQVFALITDVAFVPQPMSASNAEPRHVPTFEEVTAEMLRSC